MELSVGDVVTVFVCLLAAGLFLVALFGWLGAK